MPYIYAVSDIHGCKEAFEEAVSLMDLSPESGNMLVLCGDYIDGHHDHPEFFTYMRKFCEAHEGQVVALMGNHEEGYLLYLEEGNPVISEEDGEVNYAGPISEIPIKDAKTFKWLKSLKPYFETENQIFVHAGVDEEAEDLWKVGTEPWYFCSKYPATFGDFYKDIIAGHVGTVGMCKEHRVYWDGHSHFYIDGMTEASGIVPVLKYDTESGNYYSFRKEKDEDGCDRWQEYNVKVEVW